MYIYSGWLGGLCSPVLGVVFGYPFVFFGCGVCLCFCFQFLDMTLDQDPSAALRWSLYKRLLSLEDELPMVRHGVKPTRFFSNEISVNWQWLTLIVTPNLEGFRMLPNLTCTAACLTDTSQEGYSHRSCLVWLREMLGWRCCLNAHNCIALELSAKLEVREM